MKFNFSIIQNPIADNPICNSVTGTLPTGEKIVVSRHQCGWEVNLKIVIDDILWHDSPAMPNEQQAFNTLQSKALEDQFNNSRLKRDKVNKSAQSLLMKA